MNQKAFTVVELLVVVAVVGIVLAIALPIMGVAPFGPRLVDLPPGMKLDTLMSITPLSYTTVTRQPAEPPQTRELRQQGLLSDTIITIREH